MRWGLKTDIIAMFLAGGGFIFIFLAVGLVAPIIINIKQGNLGVIITIVVLLALICCSIYFLRCRKHKNKKPKGKEKQ